MKIFRFILVLMIFLFWSCQNEGDAKLSEQLSFEQIEQIAINLSIDGEINPELLIGEWEPIKFAFTADGKNISRVTSLKLSEPPYKTVNMFDECQHMLHPFFYDDELLGPVFYKNRGVMYSRLGNLIAFKEVAIHYFGYGPITSDEEKIWSALTNTYSFVIKGDELMIHFKGEDKNLLILKKQ